MKTLKKVLALALVMMLCFGLFTEIPAQAKTSSLAKPKTKVKLVNDSTAVKITISNVQGADGFEVFVNGFGDLYKGYKDEFHYQTQWVGDFRKIHSVKQSGNKKTSVVLNSLGGGDFTIKVRAYKENGKNDPVYSKLSNGKAVSLKDAAGLKTSYDFSKIKKGDVIEFGVYEQDNDFTDGKEAIEWIVLSKTKDSMLVMSKYALDDMLYHNVGFVNVPWEDCNLRKWLNDKFYNSAFNEAEKKLIINKKIKNTKNPISNITGGKSTKDKVFLLSMDEVTNKDYGFDSDYNKEDISRQCYPTKYAFANGVWAFNGDGIDFEDNNGTCWWWLRTRGSSVNLAAEVTNSGSLDTDGRMMHDYREGLNGVRPVMYIKIK